MVPGEKGPKFCFRLEIRFAIKSVICATVTTAAILKDVGLTAADSGGRYTWTDTGLRDRCWSGVANVPIWRAELNQNLTRVVLPIESTLANDSSFRDHCKQTSS